MPFPSFEQVLANVERVEVVMDLASDQESNGLDNFTLLVQGGGTIPWWNSFSLMVFLCWFGAAGYLLTRHSSFVALIVLLVSVVCGLAGGAIVFLFLVKVMLPHEHELSADETAVVGAVGTVTCAIRPAGTGEIVYEQLGARRSAPSCSDDGSAIERDEEVFVVRYEKGIAYVRRWEEEKE